jgi:hypothetical protein
MSRGNGAYIIKIILGTPGSEGFYLTLKRGGPFWKKKKRNAQPFGVEKFHLITCPQDILVHIRNVFGNALGIRECPALKA